jgi:hypothetical protein
MKTMSLICAALALGVPALAPAQRGGGGMAAGGVQRVQRVDVQRIDPARTLTPGRDIDVRRGDAAGGVTGTRLRRRDHDPDRRLHNPARRRWNAAHPPATDPSRRRGDR